jgi:hypothetical protein
MAGVRWGDTDRIPTSKLAPARVLINRGEGARGRGRIAPAIDVYTHAPRRARARVCACCVHASSQIYVRERKEEEEEEYADVELLACALPGPSQHHRYPAHGCAMLREDSAKW